MAESEFTTPCLDEAPHGRRNAARHEAGHVLLAYIGNVAIASVRVTDAGTGKVVPIGDVGDAPRSWLHAAIAGTVAQAPDLAGPSPHMESDDGRLAYAAGLMLDSTTFNGVQVARHDVMVILEDHRCHHTLLAEYLCVHHNTTIEWVVLAREIETIFATCAEA